MERWDAYNRAGEKLEGFLVRGEPIPAGMYHLVCCMLVRHRDGRYLLMLRSAEKEVWPNAWEIGAGGSVLQGETAEEAARRELQEETGLTEGTWQTMERSVNEDTQAIYAGFLFETDAPPDSIRLQPGETADYRWVTESEFLSFFDSDQCIPRIRRRLQGYVDSLRESG